jgi:hypothetical protein
MDEPIDKAIDKIGESGQKIASAAVSGAIKVGTDGLGAVPGVGVVVGTLKTASDLAAAASNMSGAVSEGTETLKDLVGNVKDAVNDAEKEVAETTNIATDVNRLGQQQIVGRQIGGRIKKSILEFENPLQNKNKIGGYKTKRKFYKNKRSSTNKRVNFSI